MKQLEADIYQSNFLVGHFYRTELGSALEFVPGDELQIPPYPEFFTSQIKYGATVKSEGINLPPYFINLLPEGIRLLHLQSSTTHLAKDDLLGLIKRIGRDMIGDIDVVPHDEPLLQKSAKADFTTFQEIYDDLYQNAAETKAIAGVQKKISDVSISLLSPRLPSSIIKLNPPDYPGLVENEEFFLRMAKGCGIKVPQAKLLIDTAGEPGLVVRRFDRIKAGTHKIKLHQEDMCQLTNSYPGNKYDIKLKSVVEQIQVHATSPANEIHDLLQVLAFSYLIGNADHHAKNISLIWNLNGTTTLSPAYDMLSTLPYKGHERNMVFKIEVKDSNLKARDFIDFGLRYGIPEPATKMMLSKLTAKAASWIPKLTELPYDAKTIEFLQLEIESRRTALTP